MYVYMLDEIMSAWILDELMMNDCHGWNEWMYSSMISRKNEWMLDEIMNWWMDAGWIYELMLDEIMSAWMLDELMMNECHGWMNAMDEWMPWMNV